MVTVRNINPPKGFPNRHESREILYFSLQNTNGLEAVIMNWGARLLKVNMPDKQGKRGNVVLAYPSLDGYLHDDSEIGSLLVARYVNRIRNHQFIDPASKQPIELVQNWLTHTLHSDYPAGRWSNRFWEVKDVGKNYVELGLVSGDSDQRFPGQVDITMELSLTDDNRLIQMTAARVSGKTTPLNIGGHVYWNFEDYSTRNVQSHIIETNAAHFLEVDKELIPTGKVLLVQESPYLNFLTPKRIGDDAKNIDNCLVFPRAKGTFGSVRVYSPYSGRGAVMSTNEPCSQFYVADHMGDPPFLKWGELQLNSMGQLI